MSVSARLVQMRAEVIAEIAELTATDPSEVAYRFERELDSLGWNVSRDVERFGVTPHRFDDRMIALYRDGDGFIYETLAFWLRPYRQRWIELALERIRALGPDAHVLMLGDGAGSDSLFLSRNGVSVDYCDFPGSRTFDFAVRRFQKHHAKVNVIHRDQLGSGYDAVISFEVLEHLPNPMAELRIISGCLRPHGIALVTEAFEGVKPSLPTHLSSNTRFAGKLPSMCAEVGLSLSWHGPDWKPWEFIKHPARRLRVALDPRALKFRLYQRHPHLWKIAKALGRAA